jgi:hypothetical protein
VCRLISTNDNRRKKGESEEGSTTEVTIELPEITFEKVLHGATRFCFDYARRFPGTGFVVQLSSMVVDTHLYQRKGPFLIFYFMYCGGE